MHDENDSIKLSFEMEKVSLTADWEEKFHCKDRELESTAKKLNHNYER